MDLHQIDLTGIWKGWIVHPEIVRFVEVVVRAKGEEGFYHGTYSFPTTNPTEKGGKFTGKLNDSFLYVTVEESAVQFPMNIIGEEDPEMMYGAIPRANGDTPHATITVFPASVRSPIIGLWQKFF